MSVTAMLTHKRILLVPLVLATLVLGACDSNDDDDNPVDTQTPTEEPDGTGDNDDTDTGDTGDTGASASIAVIATAASDFSSGAVGLFDTTAPFAGDAGLNPGVSDTIVRAFEDNYFVIRRFQSDTVAAYSIDDTSTPLLEVSTNSDDEEASSNPHDLIFLNAEKAYLLRYGSPILWVVNPSVTDSSQFKIGEIDLSAYDVDGVPQMTRGVIVDGRLFVFMQRLEAGTFAPTQDGAVAVIDTATDMEIDTGSDGALNGVTLPAVNPSDISLDESTGMIFAAAVGDFGAFDGSRPSALSGGIVTLDTADFSTNVLVDDNEFTGRITAVEVVDANTAFMITASDEGLSSLDRFNPNTGLVEALGVAGFSNADLRDIATGPAGNLWVAIADASAPRVVVINPADNSIVTQDINPVLNPINITFTQ